MAHLQGMYGDPAKFYENRQNYDLSKFCKPCINHSYSLDGVRQCKLKKLEGNNLSMCGEFKSKPPKGGTTKSDSARAQLKALFQGI
jgi:hypothetical protein